MHPLLLRTATALLLLTSCEFRETRWWTRWRILQTDVVDELHPQLSTDTLSEPRDTSGQPKKAVSSSSSTASPDGKKPGAHPGDMEPSQRNWALTPVVFDGLKVGVSPNFYTNSRLLVTLTENVTPLDYLLSEEMEFSKGRFRWPVTGWPGDQYWGFVDLDGKLVVAPVYYDAHAFSEGVAAVNACPPRSPRWGMIDIEGRVVVPFEYDWLGVMSEGRVAFARDGKFGYMDREGHVLIPPKFAVAGAFRGGKARVRRSPIRNAEGYGPFTSMDLINDKGRIVGREETGYGDIDDFEALLDRDRLDFLDEDTRLWGYRSSQNGEILISPRFASARPFSEGLAPVQTHADDKTCEYIDKRGTVVFSVPHATCYPLRQGRALAWSYKSDSDQSGSSVLRWAVYDQTGSVVFDHIEGYDDVLPERVAGICKDDGALRTRRRASP